MHLKKLVVCGILAVLGVAGLSNFRAECALCHANFPAGPTSDYVGALMLRVPIE